jgi:peptidyl-prolyl cis-trans isomerase SurA
MSYLNKRVNVDSVNYVRVERGLWKQGSNKVVDKYGFKVKGAEYQPGTDYPVVIVMGKVLDNPQEYTDDRGKVTTDYQDYLEKQWVATLREKYPVVINEEVWQSILNTAVETK